MCVRPMTMTSSRISSKQGRAHHPWANIKYLVKSTRVASEMQRRINETSQIRRNNFTILENQALGGGQCETFAYGKRAPFTLITELSSH